MQNRNIKKSSRYSDKYFLCSIILIWLFIPLADFTANNVLSREFYAFRAWEVVVEGGGRGPFISSFVFKKTIYGDLANMLKVRKYRQYRSQIFTTDSHGFRNTQLPDDTYYPIVVLGDSDMAGSSLSDEETFPSQLEKLLNIPVYNYAPYSIFQFLADDRFKKNPPKILIWESIERTIYGANYQSYAKLPENANFRIDYSGFSDKRQRQGPKLSTYLAREIFQEARWYLTGLKSNKVNIVEGNTGMLFYTPAVELLQVDSESRAPQKIIAGIKKIQKILSNRGIRLIYMPLPDKENIYRKLLPPGTPGRDRKDIFLKELHNTLCEAGVENIDLYNLFNNLSTDGDYLYFKDDTHWNKRGVKIAAEAAALYLKDKIPQQEKTPIYKSYYD